MSVRPHVLRSIIVILAIVSRIGPATCQAETSRPEVLVTLDATDAGRVYEGVGAVSAGASTRNLVDYPDAQRGEVLDYLFKPKFGAGRVLASGLLSRFDASAWHRLKLTFHGQRIRGFIDETMLAEAQDGARGGQGMAYLASTYDPNCFDNVAVASRGD
jgi:hypothetical protein